MIAEPEADTKTPLAKAGLWPLAVVTVMAAASAWVLTHDPTVAAPGAAPAHCWWNTMFGLQGPLCGGTRMYWYLLHGDLVAAARHHLLALAGLTWGLYLWLAWVLGVLSGLRLPAARPSRRALAIFAGVFVAYGIVLRMLPWEPFSWFFITDSVRAA